MSNINIYIIVEGPTEQTFVRDILNPELSHQGIYLYPRLIGKPGHKGGDINFNRAQKDIKLFLKQRCDTYVSTMFDYFRIDVNWPGREDVDTKIRGGAKLTACDKAKVLEAAMLAKLTTTLPKLNITTRFIPYIEMHEFEALLFSNAEILAEKAQIDLKKIQNILADYNTPEEINDNKAPSKRLEALKQDYRKVVMGRAISRAIGIQTIRQQCPHFDFWLTKLEHLAPLS